MSKSSKSTDGPASTGGEMAFEEALKRLETIVEDMENDELPLEKLLARYEEGTRLARHCQTKLAEAELKIQQLEKNAGGDLSLKPVSLSERQSTESPKL